MASGSNFWSISGKTCLITGANRGIGYETALELARRGARRVILACRDMERANLAALSIRSQIVASDCVIKVVKLDLASLASVRQCAEKILAEEYELHILINNAAIKQAPEQRQLTEDGFDLVFETNYLGHFLLTNLLLALLKRSSPSRVIIVASDCYIFCSPSGLNLEQSNYSPFQAYCQSKLAAILFGRQLHQRVNVPAIVQDDESSESSPAVEIVGQLPSQIAVFALHPGFKFQSLSSSQEIVTNNEAASCVYCACEPGLEERGGYWYFSNSAPLHVWPVGRDDTKAQQLWEMSEKMTNLL